MTMGQGTLILETKKRVYEEVITALERHIDRENLRPGQRLPSAEDLANELSVSTRSVREAYTSLRAIGLVQFRQGKGVYLIENSLDHYLESLATSLLFTFSEGKELLLELTYTRHLIESGIVEDVANNPTPEVVDSLSGSLDRMRSSLYNGDLDLYNELDREFHETLVLASGNRIIGSLYMHLSRLLSESIEVTQYYGGRLEETLEEHRQLVKHIAHKQPRKAREAMLKHLERTRITIESLTQMKERKTSFFVGQTTREAPTWRTDK